MVVTTLGLTEIRNDALDAFDTETHMAIGTGTTAEDLGDTTLASESFRNAIYSTTKNTTNGTYDLEMRVPISEANATLTELGVFDAAAAGNMSVRELFDSSIVKTSDDELFITLQVTVVAS